MVNYFTEDISISKGSFFQLFISYTLSFFLTIAAATIYILKVIATNGLPIWSGTVAYIGTAIGGIAIGILVSKKVPPFNFLRLLFPIMVVTTVFVVTQASRRKKGALSG